MECDGRFAPGERVAIWAANHPEWVLLELGAAYAGITLVTVNPADTLGELTHVLAQSRSSGVVVQDEYRGRDLIAIVEEARAATRLVHRACRYRDFQRREPRGADELPS
ncbi:MAG: AMP-binding protein, partial [Actinomycetes bacterium]